MARRWMSAQEGQPTCEHARGAPVVVDPARVCQECVQLGTTWVHLRRCLTCQHVGCCDSSPQRHASEHWRATDHPVASSAERGEHWAWCFPNQLLLIPAS